MTMPMMISRMAAAEVELVAVERGVERGADAAAADDADHRQLAEIDVEPVEAEPDHARHHLRLDAEIDPLQPAGAGGAHRLGLRRVHVLDVLGEQLAVEADGGERQRHDAGERAEAEQLDEEDGEDDLLEAARHREDAAAEIVDRSRRDVLARRRCRPGSTARCRSRSTPPSSRCFPGCPRRSRPSG